MIKKYSLLWIFIFFSFSMFSQTYTMSNGANGTVATCSGTFVDDGGGGNYANSQNSTITFCPSTPGDIVKIVFNTFDTEGGGGLCTDYLDVWYANAVGAVGTNNDRLCGALGTATLISTSPDGCISLQFISNNNTRRAGWSATISCATPCVTPIAGLVDSSTVNICPSTATNPGALAVNFNGSASNAPGGFSISAYEWSWGDGTTSTTASPNTSHTFPGPGIYSVSLSVRNNNTDIDPLGCQSTNAATRVVRVLPPPDFTGSSLTTFNVSCGDSVNLNGLATSQTMATNPLSVSGSPIALPDGSGVNYNTTLDFTGLFPVGATMTPGCYPTITFDLEHTYSGDLQLTLISPTGQSVLIYDQHGNGTNFGVCANPADDGVAGCPATYTVVNAGGVNWTAAGVTTVAPVSGTCSYTGLCETGDNYISQTYNSTNPFTSLNGADLNGVWTLRVRDNIFLDDGTITGWSLAFPGSCYANAEFVTPDIATLTWSNSGAGPVVPAQTTTSTIVIDPGPGGCPAPGTCVGNQLTNNVTVGPFLNAGSFTYTLTAVDEYGCNYVRNVAVNVAAVCPTAAISYTGSPFCSTSLPVNVNLTGTGSYTTGVFSAPAGLSINSATGQITPATSTPGTYTVTYTIAPNACCAVPTVTTTSVTISAGPVLSTLTSNSPICSGNNAVFNITGTPNAIVSYNINLGASQTTTINAGGTVTVTVPSVTTNTTFNAINIAAAGTPVTGNGLSAVGGITPANSTGAISALGAAAVAGNCTQLDNTNLVLTITLQHTVPAGTSITVSLARDNAAGDVTVSSGGSSVVFNGGTLDLLSQITIIPTVSTNTITFTRNAGRLWIDGVQYTFTPPGCSSTITNTATVVVNPLNTIASGTNQTVCINSAITNIALATTGATGATFAGLPAGVTGSWAGNVATISGTPTVSGTFNYTVTTTGGCPPATTIGTITVTPLNTIAAGTNQTVCINSVITNIALATTGATGATFAGLPAGVTGSWAGNVATISGTPTVSGTFNYTVTTTGGCPPATATGTITVTPLNTIASGTNQTVCINSAITNIALATTGATGATFAGLPAGVTGSWAGNVATISGTPTVSGTFNYTVTTTGGCPPATATGTITVTPLNTIAAGTNQTVCINSAITNIALATTGATGATFAGLPAGVTGSWAGNVATISGTPTVSGTFNYTVTTTGGCPPATTIGTITVTPLNTIAAGTNQTVCINSAITNITLATTGATGATFAGLPAGVTGSWSGNVATISGTPTVSGTFNYTVTTTGGCPPATATGTITVTPLNTIASGTNQTVCINSAITTITLATTGATGATFTGLPAGVTGSWAGNVATISGTPTASGTFNYTVTTTGGCPPATATGTITVNPTATPVTGFSYSTPVCINSTNPTPTPVAGFTTGGVYSSTLGLTINSSTGEIDLASSTAGTYTVTYFYGATACGAAGSSTFNITILPQNVIASGTNQTVCINSAITNIALATTGATGATFAGLPAGVTGSWSGNVATISGTPTVSGTFNYTVTTTGGCPPATATGAITVTPLNTIAAGTNQTVCINSAITNITLATTGATGVTFAGLPAGVTGSWAGNVATISGTPTASGTFNYTVTTTGGCPPATATGTITVTPLNTIASGTNQTVCINSAITNIALATTGATGATFAGLPAGVTGSWSGNVATISGTPTVSGTFNYTVTTTGGCPPATTTGTITVTPLNTIAAGTNQTVCINSAITNIALATTGATGATFAGLPAGVTGSWAGNVATISGTPTVSGTFNYTVTTTGGCPPATATGTITVTPLNTIASGTNQTVCINSAITNIALATTGATGATFAGLPAGVNGSWVGNVATISGTPTASGTFNYTVTTTGGCPPATATGTITVNLQNTIASGTSQSLCVNTAITNITLATTGATGATFTGLPPGVTGSWAGNNVTITGTATLAGTFNYTVTTTGGCPPATATGTITVNPLPLPVTGFSYSTPVCINSTNPTPTPVAGFTTGGVYSSTLGLTINSSTGEIDLASSTAGTYTVTYFYGATACGAAGSSTFNITILPQNVIASGTNQTVCINSAITNIALATTGATGATFAGLPAGVTGSWAGNVATISGTPTVSGTFNYTVTTTGGCPPATTIGTITVTPLNTIASGTNQTVCINSAITNITLATTGATGATFAGLPAGVTGSWSGNVATISGTPTVSGTFNYTVTTTGGCPPATATGTITVTPLNTIASGTNQTVCINSAITNITLATTGATGATFAGLPAGVTGSWVGNVATISGTPTASGTFNYTVTTTGGCPPATTTGTITVTPLNTIAAGTNQTICINSAITNIALATTGATGATFAGLPAGVTGSWAGNVATISGTPTVSGTFNYTVTTTGGCPPATTIGTITVTPLNTIASGTNQTVCINSAITNITLATTGATGATFAGLPAGVTGSWSGNVATISGTPTVSGTFNYTVTTTGGCPPATATGTITVTPLNTIASGTNQTVCINSAITNIALATTGATGATFAGLPAGVTGSWAGNVATIIGTPTVSGTFNYTVTTTGGCPPATATGTITVTPLNTIAAGTNQTVCINSAITNITLATTGATGATFAGLPAGVTGSWSGNVATIIGTPTVSGTFNYTVTTTGGCPPATATGTITVDIPNTASISYPLPLYCVAEAPVAVVITGTGNYTGGQFSAIPVGLSINASSGLITPAASTPGTYQVNYLVPSNGACSSFIVSTTITIAPRPTITNVAFSSNICNGSSTDIVLSSNLLGTTYTWSATISNITGTYVTNGDETNINQIATLTDTENIGTITMVIIPRANGCDGTPRTIEITVNPNPVIESVSVSDTAVCSGSNVHVDIVGNISGITYTWTAITSGVTVVGGTTSGTITATSTTTGFDLQVITSNPLVAGTIYFEVSSVRNGCTGNTLQSGVVTVNPNPGLPIPSPIKTICSEEGTDLIVDVSPLILGTELTWEVLTVVNVTGANPGTGVAPVTINDILTATTNTQGYVIYRVRSTLGDCQGGYTDYRVNVNPSPRPVLTDGNICITASGEVYQTYTLNTGLNDVDYDFEWFDSAGNIIPGATNSTLVVDEAGTYSVIATNWLTGCSSDPLLPTATAVVTETTPATTMTIVQSEYFSDNATITVTVTGGSGSIMYSLDEGSFQSSNVFTGVSAGEHLVTVIDTEGCTYMTQEVLIIDYPTYFTPNGDGINETWNIIGLNQADAKLYIFDRYGKLLKQLSTTEGSEGWDGTYNQELLPSTDYWFTLDYTENGVGKQFKAHFSLIR